MNQSITEFRGVYAFLSNFYPANVKIEDLVYPASENAYHAQKTDDIQIKQALADPTMTPGKALRFSRTKMPFIRPNWDMIRLRVMSQVVYQKFNQNVDLAGMLIDTHPMILIEGNKWKDTFWGVYEGRGENHLGKILMDVRKDLLARAAAYRKPGVTP